MATLNPDETEAACGFEQEELMIALMYIPFLGVALWASRSYRRMIVGRIYYRRLGRHIRATFDGQT